MFKKFLFLGLLILIAPFVWKQNPNAKTWERYSTSVPAESIMAAIQRGDSVAIYGCEISGSLTKGSRWEKPDTLNSFIWISFSTFLNAVSFENCHFVKRVVFRDDTLSDYVNFSEVSFNDDVDFSGIVFKGLASFSRSTFSGYSNFMEVTFYKLTHFSDATFKKSASFWSATFYTLVSFDHARFKGGADFTRTTFYETADLSDATFGGDADFMKANFGGLASFARTTFSKSANFSMATFNIFASFMHGSFKGTADFSHTAFEGSANFLGTTFGGQVNLSPKEFKNIYTSWKQLKGHLVYDPPANLKLMKHFEQNRQLVSADGVYLFLKDQERMNKSRLRRYFEYWVLQLPCGYGVRPWNILFLSIGIILIFTLFYTKSNGIKEIEKEFGNPRRRRIRRGACRSFRKRWRYAFYFSFQTFIIGVVPDWYPTDEFLIKFWKIKLFKFRTLSMIEGALGWVLLVLFVVTLTRKFIR